MMHAAAGSCIALSPPSSSAFAPCMDWPWVRGRPCQSTASPSRTSKKAAATRMGVTSLWMLCHKLNGSTCVTNHVADQRPLLCPSSLLCALHTCCQLTHPPTHLSMHICLYDQVQRTGNGSIATKDFISAVNIKKQRPNLLIIIFAGMGAMDSGLSLFYLFITGAPL